MTNSIRVTRNQLLAGAMLLFAATFWAQNRPPIVEKIEQAHGLDSFGQVEAIRYTFNLDLPGLKVTRSWIWEPKADRVTFEGKDKTGNPVKVTYMRSQLSTLPDNVKNQIDPGFINDQYTLLFPFHVAWDNGATVEDNGKHKLPIGSGSAEQVVVKYPSEGGYTPGDTWELFFGPDYRVQQFFYHRGGDTKPSTVIAKWGDYRKAGPLLLSLDRTGTADGKPVRVWYSNVAVKITGSDNWIDAQ